MYRKKQIKLHSKPTRAELLRMEPEEFHSVLRDGIRVDSRFFQDEAKGRFPAGFRIRVDIEVADRGHIERYTVSWRVTEDSLKRSLRRFREFLGSTAGALTYRNPCTVVYRNEEGENPKPVQVTMPCRSAKHRALDFRWFDEESERCRKEKVAQYNC